MSNMSKKIKELKTSFLEQPIEDEEQCPDVIESEQAVVNAIEALYIEELLSREPEGDA